MKTIEAIIERAKDGGYSVYCVTEMFTGMGDSAEAAKIDMLDQMKFFKETAVEDGHGYPKFLDDPFEVVYKFDTESLLEYYSGIHQKQLWSYLHGKSKPRKAQVEKIENGLHRFGNELISLSL